MPVERVSRSFRDVSMTFQVNPLTKDFIQLKNESAIARAVRNLILTGRGERFFDPIYGSEVKKLLFENVDVETAITLREEIRLVIENYEPRVVVNDVIVTPDVDNNQFLVTIDYRIVGIDVPQQELEFALLPTR
jgi:phage baseplate assembly protein W